MNFSKLILPTIISLLTIIGCQSKQERPQKVPKIFKSNSIEISSAWARPAEEGRNSAAYMQIYNGTDQPDTLIAVESEIAGKAEVHETYEEEGMMGMRPAGVLAIKSDSVFNLQPGGIHIMLMKLNKSIAEGDSILLKLLFSNSGFKNISVPVKISN